MAGPYLLELHAVEAVGQVFQLRQRLQADRCVQGLLTLMLQLTRVKVMAQLEQRYGLAQCQASLDASIQPVQQQAHCVCCDVQLSGVAYICKPSQSVVNSHGCRFLVIRVHWLTAVKLRPEEGVATSCHCFLEKTVFDTNA